MDESQSEVQGELLEELDVERFSKEHPDDGKPDARFYVIRIDRERKRVREPSLTGRQILALVDKTPETHQLVQKLRDGSTKKIGPDDEVSFRAPGVERFMTIPKDTTEGGEHG